ncbi:MAG: hypothetical protein AB8C84_09430 [Oligoflexales bacterium]
MKRLSRMMLFSLLSVGYSVSVYGVVEVHQDVRSPASAVNLSQVIPAADLRVHIELQMLRIQAVLKQAKGGQVDQILKQFKDESRSLSQN